MVSDPLLWRGMPVIVGSRVPVARILTLLKEQVATVGITIHNAEVKLTQKAQGHERRIDQLEKEKGLPNPNKH